MQSRFNLDNFFQQEFRYESTVYKKINYLQEIRHKLTKTRCFGGSHLVSRRAINFSLTYALSLLNFNFLMSVILSFVSLAISPCRQCFPFKEHFIMAPGTALCFSIRAYIMKYSGIAKSPSLTAFHNRD